MLILTFRSGGKLGPASCHRHDNDNDDDVNDGDDKEEDVNDDDNDKEDEDVNPRIPIRGEIGPSFLSSA